MQIPDCQAGLLQQPTYFADRIDPMPPLSRLALAVAHKGGFGLQATPWKKSSNQFERVVITLLWCRGLA
ncbi:MAG: hypothetical protein DME18_03555 [Verrucomicrobia bacterium]|nr:MAG: hypothetical protein DME18_03555 [Verrucomicrobiota bacterium]